MGYQHLIFFLKLYAKSMIMDSMQINVVITNMHLDQYLAIKYFRFKRVFKKK